MLGRTRTLESHASRLRKKLRLADDDRFVVNVWGVGRAVAGGVRKWREVASLRRFQVSLRWLCGHLSGGLGTMWGLVA